MYTLQYKDVLTELKIKLTIITRTFVTHNYVYKLKKFYFFIKKYIYKTEVTLN